MELLGKRPQPTPLMKDKKLRKIDVINENIMKFLFLLSRKSPDWNKMAGKDMV